MFSPQKYRVPVDCELLVAFADLSAFARLARTQTPAQTFAFIDCFCRQSRAIIEPAGGRILKVIGDALMLVFEPQDVSAGVGALLDLKDHIDAWLKEEGHPSHLVIKVHFGPLTCGPLGVVTVSAASTACGMAEENFSPLDVMGDTVNIAAGLKTDSFAITPQVFRKLDAAARIRFKKHTPPVTYIDVREAHRD